MNGGRVVTDRDLYDRLDDQAVSDPESFVGVDLTQHRLSLGDRDYDLLTKRQQALAEGKPDPAFERHRLGRLFLEEGLRAANLDPNGKEARTARQQLDWLSGAFESVEGKPPTMADIRRFVDDVLPRAEGDASIVRVGGESAEANGNTQSTIVQGEAFDPGDIVLAQSGGGGARGGGGGRVPSPSRPSAAPGQRAAPGPGHNQPPQEVPPGLPTIINRLHPGSYPAPQPGTQHAPDSAGPAAAQQKAARERTDTYTIYREHLQELDPDSPLLKLEPVPGVPPDQVIVDAINREVETIVQGKLGRFVFKNYGKYPDDNTMNGEQGNGRAVRILQGDKAKAEADFAELSKRATPHAAFSGQHAKSQTILRLPGKDMYVGYRINKDGLPTIDINSPHTGSIRFHYK